METMGRLRKATTGANGFNGVSGGRGSGDNNDLLKSSPNILENFPYDDFKVSQQQQQNRGGMSSPPATLVRAATTNAHKRARSPKFCETLERHEFMRNVINTKPNSAGSGVSVSAVGGVGAYSTRYSTPSEKEATLRRSLEEISKDIKEIEDFLTATENVMRREKEQDRELLQQKRRQQHQQRESPNKENKIPNSPVRRRSSPTFAYKINSFKRRGSKTLGSPRLLKSKLYFRNGRIGCVEAERQAASNVESTHALVKHILKFENEKPLVSPESVRRVLSNAEEGVGVVRRRSNVASTTASSGGQYVPLPGEVPEPPPPLQEAFASAALVAATGRVVLDDAEEEPAMDADSQCSSQPIVDEDEQDVQICYDELPEVPNEEENLGPLLLDREILDSEMVAVNNNEPEFEFDGEGNGPPPLHASVHRLSSTGSLDSGGQQFLRDQVRHLVRRFTARANKVKSHLEMPPTPSSSAGSPTPPPTADSQAVTTPPTPPPPPPKQPLKQHNNTNALRHKPTITAMHSGKRRNLFEADTPRSNVWLCSSLCGSNNDERTLDPQGKIYISWLCVVSLSFLYNAWVIPLRSTFPFQTPENTNIWMACDFCADIVYLLDVVFFKHRLMYLFEGFWVKNKNLTRKNYMRKLQFKLDLLALLPLDLLYFYFGTKAVYLRFPRLFKIQSFWEVFKLLDRVISSPHFVRVAKTLTYMFFLIHVTACAYYYYSSIQGLNTNRWVFSGNGHPYVRCIAFSTKTATSIGKNPKPEREGEYIFMTVAWLMGVFVFALLIGQIRDIISTATRTKNEYRQLEDETLEYMRRLNLPQEVQERVKMWFKFTWDQQRTLDEANILDSLPINLKTDIAISVHIQTLSKVQLFADCEEALLRDLVLKLRAVTFLPGDYVCRKGEVGREMYIIKLGQVQVMGGPNNDVVLATLSEGSVFGEISLLGINGADRRTADVRSKGFANLFVLSKSDLNEVIAYYPQAQALLKKRARTLMRKNAAREREEARAQSALQADVVIGNPKTPETPPKLLQTVIQALPYESPAVVLITRGSRRLRQRRSTQMETIVDKEVEEINAKNVDDGGVGGVGIGVGVGGCVVVDNAEACGGSLRVRRDGTMKARRHSPDLLSSIQNELKSKNKFINLTDAEKALIISSSSSTEEGEADCELLTKATAHKE